MIYKIEVDGKIIHSVINNNPQDYSNVIVYVSDPWHVPFSSDYGSLENLRIYNFGKKDKNGDARLQNGKDPEVFWDGKWRPICGHYFWDNNFGADLFCQQLGFSSGLVKGKGQNLILPNDALLIGKCSATNEWLKCDGRCNNLGIGGDAGCNSACKAGDGAYIEIECKQGKH